MKLKFQTLLDYFGSYALVESSLIPLLGNMESERNGLVL